MSYSVTVSYCMVLLVLFLTVFSYRHCMFYDVGEILYDIFYPWGIGKNSCIGLKDFVNFSVDLKFFTADQFINESFLRHSNCHFRRCSPVIFQRLSTLWDHDLNIGINLSLKKEKGTVKPENQVVTVTV